MKETIAKLLKFRSDRGWDKYHTEAELARSLTIEATELNRLYQWGQSPENMPLGEEIADVLIYALYLCEKRKFDPVEIIKDKMRKNAIKYPLSVDHEAVNGWTTGKS